MKQQMEIFSALQKACGTYALSYSQVTRWLNAFKMPTTQVEPWRLRTVIILKRYKRLLKSDIRTTCKEMAQELELSVGPVPTILLNQNMRKVWHPYFIKFWRWERFRLGGCHIAWRRIKRNVVWKWPLISFHGLIWKDKTFLSRIVAVGETWMRSYELELKRHTPSSPRPAKYRRTQS